MTEAALERVFRDETQICGPQETNSDTSPVSVYPPVGRWYGMCRASGRQAKAVTVRRQIENTAAGRASESDNSDRLASQGWGWSRSQRWTGRIGSPGLSRWHAEKVWWANTGGPCISGTTPPGKPTYKVQAEVEGDGCVGVGGGHGSNDGGDNITPPERRAPTLATPDEQKRTHDSVR